MPGPLQRARLIKELCTAWGYTPEQALHAPVWVIQAMALLALDDEMRPKGERGA